MLFVVVVIACTGEVPRHVFPGAYTHLSKTGLYSDIETRTLAPGLEVFTPTWVLWSDGAVKSRWVSLPDGADVDKMDPDRWVFPVGTRFFKQFASPDGTLLETRLVERIGATGDAEKDYWLGAFAWRADESDADFVPDGVRDVVGTAHDVPSVGACHSCHNGETGRVLGFSEVQLNGWPVVPDDPVTTAALGYMHANCGHCHNPQGSARPDSDLDLRVRATDRQLADTGAYRTAVDQPVFRFAADAVTGRCVRANPEASALVYRMSRREPRVSMPPIGTEVVDAHGVEQVTAWVASLAK